MNVKTVVCAKEWENCVYLTTVKAPRTAFGFNLDICFVITVQCPCNVHDSVTLMMMIIIIIIIIMWLHICE